jgi:hypothetical protein
MAQSDDDLDDLFGTLAQRGPLPSEALMARVLADAAALQPRAAPMQRAAPPRGGVWAVLLAALGGRGALAGLATATLAGVWIGFAQPAPVAGLGLGGVPGGDIVELFPDDGGLFDDSLWNDGLWEASEG